MGKDEEFKPTERSIHIMCQLRLCQDVTLILIPRYGDDPKTIHLKNGTDLSLMDDRQMFCATEEGCGNGPLVRIEETKGVDVGREHIGRTVVIPARFLQIHPNAM